MSILLASCNKSNTGLQAETEFSAKLGSSKSYSITMNDFEAYKEAVTSRSKVSIDSINAWIANNRSVGKVDKSASNARIEDELVVANDIVSVAGDGVDLATHYTLIPNSDYYDFSNAAYYTTYIDVVKMQCQFSMRGNVLTIYVPYEFWWKGGSAGSAKLISKSLDGPANMNLVGAKLGDLSVAMFYPNIYNAPPYISNPVDGDIHAVMNESRTVLLSEDTQYKIVGGAEGNGINVGATMSDGFKVSGKYSSNSSYEAVGNFSINCMPWGYKPIKSAYMSAVCAGIQRN